MGVSKPEPSSTGSTSGPGIPWEPGLLIFTITAALLSIIFLIRSFVFANCGC